MGLLARIAAALRSAFGRSGGDPADEGDAAGNADAADRSPDGADDRPEDGDAAAGPATTDCSVCGTTFEADAEACPLCGTAPGSDAAAADPEPASETTDGAATDDAADRLRDLRDE
ncbi:hypothetical protein [Halostella litorea]|uniref:hypothetical protein n=1 Tax=Halostella litorea TaxID=2528831 RepID=UPI001092A512|nr:hypothetical protein [Halostella litorea]